MVRGRFAVRFLVLLSLIDIPTSIIYHKSQRIMLYRDVYYVDVENEIEA